MSRIWCCRKGSKPLHICEVLGRTAGAIIDKCNIKMCWYDIIYLEGSVMGSSMDSVEWQMNTGSKVFQVLASDHLIQILLLCNVMSKGLSEVGCTIVRDQFLNGDGFKTWMLHQFFGAVKVQVRWTWMTRSMISIKTPFDELLVMNDLLLPLQPLCHLCEFVLMISCTVGILGKINIWIVTSCMELQEVEIVLDSEVDKYLLVVVKESMSFIQ
ncbi:hypothetical protein DFH29DRAFT_880248 [Suillus ampliporus]|nr:hypothetical protein DFH29DRAFT_880248 [Suillus ampliporus]